MPATASLKPGESIDRFEIVRLLGQGGMGAVYEARDPDLARAVALKLIHEPDTHRSMRFLREAQALAQLQHPNVVAVYDVGTDGDRVFIAMELVDGQSLDHRSGKQPWREIVPLFVQVGRGLAAAHAKDLVHRDVKPSNIFVGTDGRARIGDFGLARQSASRDGSTELLPAPDIGRSSATTVDDDGPSAHGADAIAPVTPASGGGLLGSTLTGVGAYIGTPRYMAPEQHERRGATARSDQFSFCVALYESIVGEHPFVETDGGYAASVMADRRRPRPSGVPGWLMAALDRGLARDPEARHPSMTALCDLLEQTPVRRRRIAIAVAGFAALAAAAALAFWLTPRGSARVACGRAGDGLAAVWNPDVRARLEQGFAGAAPFGADSATRTTAAVDAWGTRWRDVRIDACRATHERGEQSPQVLDRRMACLDRQLSIADGVIGRLAGGGGGRLVANAQAAVESLPSPESCNAARLQAAMPYPDDPRVASVLADLEAMRAANVAGDVPEARRLAKQAKATADALGHPGLRAEVLLEYAFFIQSEDTKAAQAAREEALAEAVAAGDRDLEAVATLRLVEAATGRADVKALETLLPVARAAVAREGVAPRVRFLFRDKEAIALSRVGKLDEAKAACERVAELEPTPQPVATRCRCVIAIDSLASKAAEEPCRASLAAGETAYGKDHPSNAARMSNLATALKAIGKMDEALALDARAIAIGEAAYGPSSEDVAQLLNSAGDRLMVAGKLDQAFAMLERALAIYKTLDGERPSRRQGHSEMKLGESLARAGKIDEGLAHADRAMQIFETTIPADHPDLIKTYAQYGNINLAAERWPAVERAMGRCAELALKVHGPRHQTRAICLLGLAQYKLAGGHPAEAADDARTALEVMTELQLHPVNLGAAEGVLGRALGESGDKAGAREHLDKAIAIFEKLGPGGAASLEEAKKQRKRF